jgi:hypothetical protein
MYATETKPFQSTIPYFENWLNKKLRPPREIKADGGTYLVNIPVGKISETSLELYAYWLPDDEQPRIEYHRGVGYYQSNIDKDPQIKEFISFDITPLSTERIKVKLLWTDPAIEPYIREIRGMITDDWPETIVAKSEERIEQGTQMIKQQTETQPIVQQIQPSITDVAPTSHKGRYRLTEDEIRFRRKIVKIYEKKKKACPLKYQAEIAREIEIEEGISLPVRTLHYWRHNTKI